MRWARVQAVISSDTTEEDVLKARDLVCAIDPDMLFILQPNYFEMKNGVVQKCLALEKLCSPSLTNLRILPQIHKFMKLR